MDNRLTVLIAFAAGSVLTTGVFLLVLRPAPLRGRPPIASVTPMPPSPSPSSTEPDESRPEKRFPFDEPDKVTAEAKERASIYLRERTALGAKFTDAEVQELVDHYRGGVVSEWRVGDSYVRLGAKMNVRGEIVAQAIRRALTLSNLGDIYRGEWTDDVVAKDLKSWLERDARDERASKQLDHAK